MPLDPSAQALLDLMRMSGALPTEQAPDLPAARIVSTNSVRAIGLEPPAGVETQDVSLLPDAPCTVRVYRPAGTKGAVLPALLFLHGGGWVLGDLDSHDSVCRHLAAGAGCVVVAVDYRLAPEHPFPAALDDSLSALRWLVREAGELGVDPSRIALGGDSAGANLAAVASLSAGQDGIAAPLLQILLYPVCDLAAQSPSYDRNGTGYILPRVTMAFFIDAYAPDLAQRGDWRLSPLRSGALAVSPPTILYTAEYDILHDEGVAFAEALKAAGVATEHRETPGQMHGFVTFGKMLPVAARVLAELAADLRSAFAVPQA